MSERRQRGRFVRPTASGRRRAALVSAALPCTAVVACTLWVALALPGLHLLPGLGNDADAGVAISLQSALLGIDDQGPLPANASLRASLRALGINAHGSLSAVLSHTQSEAAFAPLVALVDAPVPAAVDVSVVPTPPAAPNVVELIARVRRPAPPAAAPHEPVHVPPPPAPPPGHDPARDAAGFSASRWPAGPDDRLHVDSPCGRDGRRARLHGLRRCELGPRRRLQRRSDECGRLHRRRQRGDACRRRHVHDRRRSARERKPSRGAAGAAVVLRSKRCGVAQRAVDLVHVAAAARTGCRGRAVRSRRDCELRASRHILHLARQRRCVHAGGRSRVVRRFRDMSSLRRPDGQRRLPCGAAGSAAAHRQPSHPDDHVHVHAARRHDGGRPGLRRQCDSRLRPAGRFLGRQLERGGVHRLRLVGRRRRRRNVCRRREPVR